MQAKSAYEADQPDLAIGPEGMDLGLSWPLGVKNCLCFRFFSMVYHSTVVIAMHAKTAPYKGLR